MPVNLKLKNYVVYFDSMCFVHVLKGLSRSHLSHNAFVSVILISRHVCVLVDTVIKVRSIPMLSAFSQHCKLLHHLLSADDKTCSYAQHLLSQRCSVLITDWQRC